MELDSSNLDFLSFVELTNSSIKYYDLSDQLIFIDTISQDFANKQIASDKLVFTSLVIGVNTHIKHTLGFNQTIVSDVIHHLNVSQSIGFKSNPPKHPKVPGSVGQHLILLQQAWANAPYHELSLQESIVGYSAKPAYDFVSFVHTINETVFRGYVIEETVNLVQCVNYYLLDQFDLFHNPFDSY